MWVVWNERHGWPECLQLELCLPNVSMLVIGCVSGATCCCWFFRRVAVLVRFGCGPARLLVQRFWFNDASSSRFKLSWRPVQKLWGSQKLGVPDTNAALAVPRDRRRVQINSTLTL